MPYNQAMQQIKKVKELNKLLVSMGYNHTRTNGSHMIFTSSNKPSLVVPAGREIAKGTLRQILKLAYGVGHGH